MSYSVFNTTKNDQLLEPMFLGQNVNVSRYDRQKYKVFESLIEKQLSFFWRPEEIDVSKDRIDYQSMPEHEKHIFISNLKYQTLLDSIQGRSPNMAFLPIVSIPELETWIETWSFSECLAEGTEVLTDTGWKDLGVVTTADQCLVYDLKDDSVFFENPKRVPEYDVEGDIVRFKSTNPKQFNQLVTPNHRMPVINRGNRHQSEQVRFFNEAAKQDYSPSQLAPISGFKHIGSKNTLQPLERLLIATQADGSWQPSRYNGSRVGTIPVWFTFTKDRKVQRLASIVDACGYCMIELTPDLKGQRRFKVNIPIIDMNNVNPKKFDWVDPTQITHNWGREFLEELSYWDSHRFSDTQYSTFTYTTSVKENADKVQAVASICGKSPRLTLREDNRSDTYSTIYSINIINSNTKDGQSINKSIEYYKGKVRCLETSTGAFIIRFNGVVSVTGNTIHSRSYTHIIRNIVGDPSVVFDDIVTNEEILKRAVSVSHYYDDLIDKTAKYNAGSISAYEVKKALYLCMMSVNILEAIRFYVSFACSFAFAEHKVMEGNAKIIKLIARDEELHLSGTQHIIKIMHKGEDDPDFKTIAAECREEAIEMFRMAAEQEKEWAKYLFKDGSMLGLNESIICTYIEYITNLRSKYLGLGIIYRGVSKNPIPWINNWLGSDNLQPAPQEVEISSYLVGQVNSTISVKEFSGFAL